MKKINIIYWTATVLIILFMLSSVIGTFFSNPTKDVVDMMDKMGFKPYLLKGLAIAKAVGIVVLLVPGWPRLKEWVYAGFAYDLAGATYGMIAIGMSPKDWFIMPVAIIILFISYIYFHKRLKLKSAVTADVAV